jgi:hypothetical protein
MLVWAFGIGAGLEWIWRYQSTGGVVGVAPASWPTVTAIHPAVRSPTLLMFVHPRCSCSRASLAELADLMEKDHGQVSAWVVFLKPELSTSDWEQTGLLAQARSIPGVRVLLDQGGAEAKRFGVHTSGHVILYGNEGQLLFSGGITASRGHVGDNNHLQQVVSILAGGTGESPFAPVYGCSMHKSGQA